ncbi:MULTISPECIES: hypothetical protein [Streptomyces]|uniref:HPt domain-containing protein n=1 Tax=Streptomyces olivaceiscleroticus TaxID=68245 RepID=A0ABN1B029_9ACTN|nr:hypothetical protein [Streptomyces niger]
MYEPIRTKSVHSMAEQDFPHRSREEELDIRLAGHLTALLTTLDELRALTPSGALDDAADRLAEQVARLRGGDFPLRAQPSGGDRGRVPSLHRRAHMLAGNALVVANSRSDKAAAALAAELLRLHDDAGKLATA